MIDKNLVECVSEKLGKLANFQYAECNRLHAVGDVERAYVVQNEADDTRATMVGLLEAGKMQGGGGASIAFGNFGHVVVGFGGGVGDVEGGRYCQVLVLDEHKAVAIDVLAELHAACNAWPKFNSAHEGCAVLLEELDELWQHVKVNQKRRDIVLMKKEAVQVAAMAMRFAIEICNEEDGRK